MIDMRKVFDTTMIVMDRFQEWSGHGKITESILIPLSNMKGFSYSLNCNLDIFFHIVRVFRKLNKPYDAKVFEKLFNLFRYHEPKIGLANFHEHMDSSFCSNTDFWYDPIQGLLRRNKVFYTITIPGRV